MKEFFVNEVWTVMMFAILAFIYIYGKICGVTIDEESVRFCLLILGLDLAFKIYPVIYLAVMRSIPDKK